MPSESSRLATQTVPEEDLELTFDTPIPVEHFDKDPAHGMSHAMKRVDYIVTHQTGDTWLIEIKDPENRRIEAKAGAAEAQRQGAAFAHKVDTGELFRDELFPKLRDTLVYLALANRAPQDRITYVVLIGIQALTGAELDAMQNTLTRLCYLPGPNKRPWPSEVRVVVCNVDAWNRLLAPHSVRRP